MGDTASRHSSQIEKERACARPAPKKPEAQLTDWTERIEQGLKEAGNSRVVIPTVFTAAPAVIDCLGEEFLRYVQDGMTVTVKEGGVGRLGKAVDRSGKT